jgi:DnaD/phage-associated family protein
MSCFKVCQDTCIEYTQLSNRFIDEYMAGANDAQLKVYLYLTRMLFADKPTSIADIADKFNYTEKDVTRALKYWDKLGLIRLCYAADHSLESVQVINLRCEDTVPAETAVPVASAAVYTDTSAVMSFPAVDPYSKPLYTAEQLRDFKSDDTTSRILFIAESYLQKTLNSSEISSMLFISDRLGFNVDLIDYLIEYCAGNGKKRVSYIEATAIDWAQHGITTPKQADIYVRKYDKSVYDIMHALGKNSTPAHSELKFINRWTQDFGFGFDVISVACERTVLTTDKHRFEYADGILSNWYNAGVHNADDISAQDAGFKAARKVSADSTAAKRPDNNKFNNFKQRDYDFDAIEKDLISN